ncbi:hypothetical protein [Lacrimispora amygdalina]|uniref:hypothetical protein n=1 Tax=Lacrimispora amygdalina TaxID=253257 RepID=UPI000BE3B657|nr:hypothetical protein [Lacrimispora amygdalina]
MSKCLPFNCKICSYYKREEIGDSDFGAVYAKECTCSKDKDIDIETEEYINDFDYESVKDCCVPEFWLVADIDEEIDKLFTDKAAMSDDLYTTDVYERFKEKYHVN